MLKLDWKSIGVASWDASQSRVEALLAQHSSVFETGYGKMNTFKATLHLKEKAKPKFHKPRPVPFAIREAVGQELDRLEKEGIVEKVAYSEWAAPLVVVPKSDGKLRLCGDYKVTINSELEADSYPLPKPDDLFATLAGGKKFSKIDLTHAYQQLNLDEKSRPLVTVNSHQGLYRYNRLPFGVASAPALFQRVMDTVLQGIPKVICYIDDILVTGDTEENHLKTLETVLQRLEKYNIRANKAKCKFFMDSVEYLGHVINAEGLHTTDEKVKAILQAPEPKNVQKMRSFLGLLHYYGKFLPNLAMLLKPLNDQLREGVSWRWTKDCAKAFAEAKTLLSNAPVLAHYDPSLPIKMTGDASAYGLGAVISHTFPDGSERPIAFASRTLSSAERNYPQVEKEALSLVYGIRKFHQYLYGRQFVMVTDHEPLLVLLGSKKEVPPLAAARLQRWALLLSAYSYQLEFRKTSKHGNADFLSRLPLAGTGATSVQYTFTIAQLQALPVTAEKLVTVTRQDPCLSRVLRYAREGWPGEVEEELKPYFHRRLELSTEGGCLLWGMRVVVPKRLHACVLQELHNDHPGVVRMKALARSICWWPQIDREIEECVRGCLDCQSVTTSGTTSPLDLAFEAMAETACRLCWPVL